MKRLVVGVFVSSIGLFGVVPAATAATSADTGAVKVHKAKVTKAKAKATKVKTAKIIDWDAPAPVSGGISAQRIDWD